MKTTNKQNSPFETIVAEILSKPRKTVVFIRFLPTTNNYYASIDSFRRYDNEFYT